MQKDYDLSQEKKHKAEGDTSVITDIVITVALVRSLYRDVKEYSKEILEKSPDYVKDKIHPVSKNIHYRYEEMLKNSFPKLHKFSHSPRGFSIGFTFSLVALWVHGSHVAHQYEHTHEKIDDKSEKFRTGIMNRYGHFSDAEIRKIVYNSAENRPY